MLVLFLDFRVFLMTQLNDQRQVGWNIGQWVHNLQRRSHTVSSSVSLLVWCMLCLFITQQNKKEKCILILFYIGQCNNNQKLASCAARQVHNLKLYLLTFKTNRCQAGSVLSSFHKQDLRLDQFTKINKNEIVTMFVCKSKPTGAFAEVK